MTSIISVCCGKGSPGATFVSVNLAAAMNRSGTKTLLLDADAHGGDLAGFLGLDPRKGLHPLKILGSDFGIDSLLEEIEERAGVPCIGGLPTPSDDDIDTLEAILTSIPNGNHQVITDLGRVDSRTARLGRPSNLVLIVVRPDLVSIHGAEKALRTLDRAGMEKNSIRLVVSGWERRHPSDVADISDALGVPMIGIIPLDRKKARRALLSQKPLEGRRAFKAFARLAEEVLIQIGVVAPNHKEVASR